jgi:hypothetical protein
VTRNDDDNNNKVISFVRYLSVSQGQTSYLRPPGTNFISKAHYTTVCGKYAW